MVLVCRGLVHRDLVFLRTGLALTRGREQHYVAVEGCLAAARLAEDPQPWLQEAYGIAVRCESPALRDRVRGISRERGVAAPRARTRRDTLLDIERRVVELIKYGRTNLQIALELRVSEKTMENHLTRLFSRTGCRSRVELVALSVAGRLP